MHFVGRVCEGVDELTMSRKYDRNITKKRIRGGSAIPVSCSLRSINPSRRHDARSLPKFDQLDKKFKQLSLNKRTVATPTYKIKVLKFQKTGTESIEALGSQILLGDCESETKDIKSTGKSRDLEKHKTRIKIIKEGDTSINNTLLSSIFDSWLHELNSTQSSNSTPTLSSERKHQQRERTKKDRKELKQPVTINNPEQSCQNPEQCAESSAKETQKYITNDEVAVQEDPLQRSKSVYKNTITSTLRYNFKRNKSIYPHFFIEHVMKYQRPPFWNFTKKGEGLDVLLTKDQLDNLYEFSK